MPPAGLADVDSQGGTDSQGKQGPGAFGASSQADLGLGIPVGLYIPQSPATRSLGRLCTRVPGRGGICGWPEHILCAALSRARIMSNTFVLPPLSLALFLTASF